MQRFYTPRFTDNNSEHHFKDYDEISSNFASSRPLLISDTYLYNRREKKGIGKWLLISIKSFYFESRITLKIADKGRYLAEAWISFDT